VSNGSIGVKLPLSIFKSLLLVLV